MENLTIGESIAYIIQLVMNHRFSFESPFVGAPSEMPGIDSILTRVWHVKKHTSPRIQETLNTIIEYVLCQSLHVRNRDHICINIDLLYASETFSEKNQKLILKKKQSIYVSEKTKDILDPFIDKILHIFDNDMKNKDPIQTLHAAYDKCSYSPMLFYTVFGNFMGLLAQYIVSDKEYERVIKTFGLGSLLDLSLNEEFYLPASVLKMHYANRADLLMRHDIKLSPPVRMNVLSALQKHYDLSLSMYEYIYKVSRIFLGYVKIFVKNLR